MNIKSQQAKIVFYSYLYIYAVCLCNQLSQLNRKKL